MKCTLLSVGDGVIATDQRNHIQVMNPLAEALTGWRKEEAFGKPIGQVLRALATATEPNLEKLATLAMSERRVVGPKTLSDTEVRQRMPHRRFSG